MQVFGYTRVSTREQADSGAGLGAQRTAILEEVRRRGWDEESVVWHEDAGFTGKDMKREGLIHTLTSLTQGEGERVLITAKVSRISRSVFDFAGIVQRSRKEGWLLLALDAPGDPTTPQGKLMQNVLISFAEFERELIAQNTREALAELKAQGVKLGSPCRTPPKVAARISRLHKAGLSLRGVAAELNADDVPTALKGKQWYASTVKSVLDAA